MRDAKALIIFSANQRHSGASLPEWNDIQRRGIP
jgi:hypothetical protein